MPSVTSIPTSPTRSEGGKAIPKTQKGRLGSHKLKVTTKSFFSRHLLPAYTRLTGPDLKTPGDIASDRIGRIMHCIDVLRHDKGFAFLCPVFFFMEAVVDPVLYVIFYLSAFIEIRYHALQELKKHGAEIEIKHGKVFNVTTAQERENYEMRG